MPTPNLELADACLHSLQIQVTQDGKTKQVPALNKHWMQKRPWMNFIPFTRVSAQAVSSDRWLAAASELSQDLQWLLNLPHHCFWSQLVHDTGARAALLSYLERAPRCYDKELGNLDEEQRKVLSNLHSLVFRVYLRLLTSNESEAHFISATAHAKTLYDRYLLDVPVMLDLCLLYGAGDTRKIIEEKLNLILQEKPEYAEDFSTAAQLAIRALKDVEAHFVTQPPVSGGEFDPVPLSDQAPGAKGEMSGEQLEDLLLFTLDTVTSLAKLLQLLPSMAPALHAVFIEIPLAHFYGAVIPQMYTLVLSLPDDAQCSDLQQKMDTLRYYYMDLARSTLGTRVPTLLDKINETEVNDLAGEYLAVLSECLAEPNFIQDFHNICPLDQELATLQQKCPDQLESDKYNFLLESIFSCVDVPPTMPSTSRDRFSAEAAEAAAALVEPSTSSVCENDGQAESLVLESIVSEIQSMLPDLGAGFLQKCLKHYNHDKESVVNAILEESLPSELKSLDRTMPLPSRLSTEETPGPSLTPRLNVFDHDEFDVMSRDNIDTSRVHRGKRKSKHRNLAQLLDDKKDLETLRDMYSRYGTVQENEYDDEYDDTYDEHDVSVDEPDPLTERRPFVVPRVLAAQRGEREEQAEYEEEEEEEEEGAVGGAPEAFAQDPALLREQAEQRRASKLGQRGQQPPPQQPPHRDVVGKPKGQGQDKNVVVNRQRKGAHKSSQANHNRRAGAQRKMRQGMIPS